LHNGRVPIVAFEPAFDTFAALVRNIQANNVAAVVTPLNVALFDETGVRPFYRSRLGAGSASHALGDARDYARQPFEPAAVEHVLTFTLDDLVRVCSLPRPTRIKLDVDGVEARVLAGAAGVLSSGPCEVYTELIEADADDPRLRQVMDFMRRLDYEVTETVEHRPPGTFPRVVDALFVRR
jgi:FkbM family methyltransferase